MLRTRLCDMFEVEYPILNAPMGGGDAPAELAAAVSAAGGLGMIGGTSVGGVEWLVAQIRKTRDLTDRPFGVGFISHFPNTGELMSAALDEGVRVIAHSFADPSPFVEAAHAGGARVLCQVRTVAEARAAAAAGVDVVVAQGTEAGGHTGRVSTLPLVPRVVDAVAPVPVLAAGGIADGRGIAAALMLGAEGVWLGTRFLGTHEAGVSDRYKARVVEATGDDTVLTDVFDIVTARPWPEGVSGRAIRNEFAERWTGHEDELRAWAMDHREEYQALGPEAEVREHAIWAGEAAGFVTGVSPAAQVVHELAADATAVLHSRPGAVLLPGE
ncbi:MAG TPA: nitronate monooxygenase [Acidimicrobiia bacterium]|nr:nitronate monooxygenase [Acidimicrobiia bacterium]